MSRELGSGADLVDYYLHRSAQSKVAKNEYTVLQVHVSDFEKIHEAAHVSTVAVSIAYLKGLEELIKERNKDSEK